MLKFSSAARADSAAPARIDAQPPTSFGGRRCFSGQRLDILLSLPREHRTLPRAIIG
jgi:hypothetical protein